MSELAQDVQETTTRAASSYYALCKGDLYLEAPTKQALIELIKEGGHQDPVILKGRRLPVTTVTRIVF